VEKTQTVALTETQKDVVDELQDHLNEEHLGSISKGDAVAHAARSYLQLNREGSDE
jgi:hypothetical protein